jgi:hypothetical protein
VRFNPLSNARFLLLMFISPICVAQEEDCGIKAYEFVWARIDEFPRNSELSTIVGYGENKDQALVQALSICKAAFLYCRGVPAETREVQFSCTTCVQVDLTALRWRDGSKTDFCKARGFEGTFSYPGYGYSYGSCYIGPACSLVGQGLNGL